MGSALRVSLPLTQARDLIKLFCGRELAGILDKDVDEAVLSSAHPQMPLMPKQPQPLFDCGDHGLGTRGS
jgi:hypothetical protein